MHRGISDFKKDYQPRTNIVQDEKGELVTDFQSILARRRNQFSQLFSVHGVSDSRQREINTLVPETSAHEVEMGIEKLRRHISPGVGQSQQNCLKQGVEHFALSSITLLIQFGISRNCLRSGRSLSLYLLIGRAIKQISACRGISLLSAMYKILSYILLSRITAYAEKIIWDHQC